ncbi:MAG: TlpA disulfide reductase family protein [Acidimicrobiia bacterium]|nr:TlpA disulfide reductase family protein [Acidimicrobiia bacterium]
MSRITAVAVFVLAVAASACSAPPAGPLPDAPTPTTLEEIETELAASTTPTVVNVWASWCLPCRSEAPLIADAVAAHPQVRFIGLNVRDSPGDAQAFLGEFLADVDMEHFADRGGRIPIELGATSGVPVTFFYRAGGDQAAVHLGIIDEPTMARLLDEIDR